VVAPDLFVTRQIIDHGVNGVLYHPGSLNSLVDALMNLRLNPARHREIRSRAFLDLEGFSTWEETGTKRLKLYQSLA